MRWIVMVSVVIPVFNREKLIRKAVNSILEQTYSDLELIVVDDGSTDRTKDILQTINDKRLRYIYQKNAGACAARNRGIFLAKGEYIAFHDSDDEWYREKLQRQLDMLHKVNADIIFCGFEKIFSDGTKSIIPKRKEERFYSQKELIYESMVSTQTILGKAAAVKNIKFDESMPRMQDYDFIIRASEEYSIYYLNQVLVTVFEQPDSITAGKKQYMKRLEVTDKLLKKYSYLCQLYPEWETKMLKTIAHCQVMLKTDAGSTLKLLCHKENSLSNNIKLILYRIGILRGILSWKENRTK